MIRIGEMVACACFFFLLSWRAMALTLITFDHLFAVKSNDNMLD